MVSFDPIGDEERERRITDAECNERRREESEAFKAEKDAVIRSLEESDSPILVPVVSPFQGAETIATLEVRVRPAPGTDNRTLNDLKRRLLSVEVMPQVTASTALWCKSHIPPTYRGAFVEPYEWEAEE